jgi:Fe-S-cluster containining protein
MAEDEKPCKDQSDEEIILSEEEKAYIKKMLERLMELGVGAVYGDEDDTEETVLMNCEENKKICRGICCSFIFALTKEEANKETIKWNPKRPFFIARDEDGYCPHLDRESLNCKIWGKRPERCRKYDCRKDKNVWADQEKKILNKDVFKHLPKKN